MKKVLLVFGTRPEAIKMAPLIDAFKQAKTEMAETLATDANARVDAEFDVKVCVTAQHRGMLDQVLNTFSITPDYDLNVMKPGQDLVAVTAEILAGINAVLKSERPDIVLVHGDTTTSSAAAWAAFYQKIKIGHVEAGLRTQDLKNPWPEEANRRITGVLADFHFAPTQTSYQNLLAEGHDPASISVTGNTVIDALQWVLNKINTTPELETRVRQTITDHYPMAPDRRCILVTGHRRESFGDGFRQICEALKTIALQNPDVDIVYPVHLNPAVQVPVTAALSEVENVYLIPPLDYETFIYLLNHAYLIITDSGGIQEEAPSLGKPVLVMRNTTERPEAVEAGTVKLVGTDPATIVRETQRLLDDPAAYATMKRAGNPYGDGNAARRIVGFLKAVPESRKD